MIARIPSSTILRIAWVLAASAVTAPATTKDPNQPLRQGDMEFGVGYHYTAAPGMFGADGGFVRWRDLGRPEGFHPAAYGYPLRFRLGLGQGVDLRGDWDATFWNKDAGDRRGMGQPKVGLRFVHKMYGAYTDYTLPFATGDFDNGNLKPTLEVGGILRRRFERFRVGSMLGYRTNFEENRYLRVSLRPEALWGRASTYLGVEYLKHVDRDRYLLAVNPGVRVRLVEGIDWETNLPWTVMGRDLPVIWQIRTMFFWSVGS